MLTTEEHRHIICREFLQMSETASIKSNITFYSNRFSKSKRPKNMSDGVYPKYFDMQEHNVSFSCGISNASINHAILTMCSYITVCDNWNDLFNFIFKSNIGKSSIIITTIPNLDVVL